MEALLQVVARLIRSNEPAPTLGEIRGAVDLAMIGAALRLEHSCKTAAAERLGIPRRSLYRIIERASPQELRQYMGMPDPFDHSLFPFVRAYWPAQPDGTFLQAYTNWFHDEVVPRAVDQGVKVVGLDNFAEMSGPPGPRLIKLLIDHNASVTPDAKVHGAGAVHYMPNMLGAKWLAAVVNMCPIPLKMATTADEALTHVANLFATAGQIPPAGLAVS